MILRSDVKIDSKGRFAGTASEEIRTKICRMFINVLKEKKKYSGQGDQSTQTYNNTV